MKPGRFGPGPSGKPAIEWWRPGVAAAGEPSTFTEVREYDSEDARLAAFFGEESERKPDMDGLTDADVSQALKTARRHDPNTGCVVNPAASYHLAMEASQRRIRFAVKPSYGVVTFEVYGLKLPLLALESKATRHPGFYIGTQDGDGPTRESIQTWPSREQAQAELDDGQWAQTERGPLRRHGVCALDATGKYLELQVLKHARLPVHFLGTAEGDRIVSRESLETFNHAIVAARALATFRWTQIEVAPPLEFWVEAGGGASPGRPLTKDLGTLGALWADFSNVPVDENDCIEHQFLDFTPGTFREEIWHWFEAQNPAFVVGDEMSGRRQEQPFPRS